MISPEQAVWLPTGSSHRVGPMLGAEFRSLWITDEAGRGLPERPTLVRVIALPQALVVGAPTIKGEADHDGDAGRVTGLVLDQLRRSDPLSRALPCPFGGR